MQMCILLYYWANKNDDDDLRHRHRVTDRLAGVIGGMTCRLTGGVAGGVCITADSSRPWPTRVGRGCMQSVVRFGWLNDL